jgi:hypothetical protein
MIMNPTTGLSELIMGFFSLYRQMPGNAPSHKSERNSIQFTEHECLPKAFTVDPFEVTAPRGSVSAKLPLVCRQMSGTLQRREP